MNAPSVPLSATREVSLFNKSALVADDVVARMSVAQFTAASHVPDYTVAELPNGNHIVRGLRIFRSGTFKDSQGRKRTYTADDLQKMVGNFNHLVENKLFTDVPTRADHSGSVKDVVGYVRGIRTDGKFLDADVEFTEKSGWDKFQSGTFRARSSEVGFYESNDDELFWPVLCGVAFVDVGAVEGLYGREDLNKFNLLTDIKESHVDEATFLAACAYAQALIDLGLTDVVTKADHNKALDTAIATATAAAAASFTKSEAVTFKVAGQDTADYAAVQLHIRTLETAQDEARKVARSDFVKALAADGRIAATQIDALTEVCSFASMSDDAFVVFQKAYGDAPKSSLFAKHGQGVTTPAGQFTDLDDEITIARDTVAMHRRSGMSTENLEKTDSFKRLTVLEAQRTAA